MDRPEQLTLCVLAAQVVEGRAEELPVELEVRHGIVNPVAAHIPGRTDATGTPAVEGATGNAEAFLDLARSVVRSGHRVTPFSIVNSGVGEVARPA